MTLAGSTGGICENEPRFCGALRFWSPSRFGPVGDRGVSSGTYVGLFDYGCLRSVRAFCRTALREAVPRAAQAAPRAAEVGGNYGLAAHGDNFTRLFAGNVQKLPRNGFKGSLTVLVEFSVSNFRSIRERQTLTFVATSGDELEATHVFNPIAPGVDRLVRSAVIYGANAAGKSNLLRGLDVMQDIVLLKNQLGDHVPVVPFLFDEHQHGPTMFEVVFIRDGVKFQYGFACTRDAIVEEWLYAFPEKRAQRWFHRKSDEGGETNWEFGASLRGKKKDWSAATRPNALFLSTAIQLNADSLKPIFSWFRDTLRLVVGSGVISEDYTIGRLDIAQDRIVSLLKNADTGIHGLEVFKKPPGEMFREIAEKALPEDVRQRIIDNASKGVRAKHIGKDGQEIWLDMEDESEGTKKLFACAGPFIDVLENGRVLVIDELNNSLHPIMVKWIIDSFNSPVTNPKNAQLLFATHATSVLSLEIFRRDQIWFAEKSDEGATSIYPLTDFSPRKEASIAGGYLRGRYGAIPFLTAGTDL